MFRGGIVRASGIGKTNAMTALLGSTAIMMLASPAYLQWERADRSGLAERGRLFDDLPEPE